MDNTTMRMQQAANFAMLLKEAIFINDKAKMRENIKRLIDVKAVVQIQALEICYPCTSHIEIFGSEQNRFNSNQIATVTHCKYNHMFCQKCTQVLVDQFGSLNSAECFYCEFRKL